jgi:hypothetical protein
MFGLKSMAQDTNKKKLQELFLSGEEVDCFQQLGAAWVATTTKGRLFLHEVEKRSEERRVGKECY